LIRADNGSWSGLKPYERQFDNILIVQDDIAGEVAKAPKAPIATKAGQP